MASRARLLELSIFPEDAVIPTNVVATYWGMSVPATRAMFQDLADASMLTFTRQSNSIRVHDVLRDYLRRLSHPGELRANHERLLDSIGDPNLVTEPYFLAQLSYHMVAAGRLEELCVLISPGWRGTKRALSGSDYWFYQDLRRAAEAAEKAGSLPVLLRLRFIMSLVVSQVARVAPELIGAMYISLGIRPAVGTTSLLPDPYQRLDAYARLLTVASTGDLDDIATALSHSLRELPRTARTARVAAEVTFLLAGRRANTATIEALSEVDRRADLDRGQEWNPVLHKLVAAAALVAGRDDLLAMPRRAGHTPDACMNIAIAAARVLADADEPEAASAPS